MNWYPATVIKRVSPVTYLIKEGKRTRFVHADHLKKNMTHEAEEEIILMPPRENFEQETESPKKISVTEHDTGILEQPRPNQSPKKIPTPEKVYSPEKAKADSPKRPQRIRRKPQKLDL